jgi:hypothetical protein
MRNWNYSQPVADDIEAHRDRRGPPRETRDISQIGHASSTRARANARSLPIALTSLRVS